MATEISAPIHSVTVGSDDVEHRAVFLHGLFGRGKNFTTVARALEADVQSLLVDLPNHGVSGWTRGFSYAEMADLVAAHLRESGFLDRGPVDVIGHSMGGKVAMVLALRHPEIVRRLAVLDISPTVGGTVRGEFPHLLASLTELDLAPIEKRGDASLALRESIPSHTVRGFLLQNLKRGDAGFEWEPNLALLQAELSTIMDFPETTDQSFDGPVLWLGGERSDYVTDADVPSMRALFPHTRRMTVRGAGHWLHSEQPDIVIAALRTFILRGN